eukprot:6204842-Pleurochrysis_carterae.AAC.1
MAGDVRLRMYIARSSVTYSRVMAPRKHAPCICTRAHPAVHVYLLHPHKCAYASAQGLSKNAAAAYATRPEKAAGRSLSRLIRRARAMLVLTLCTVGSQHING